jgi:hypothetical protein
MRHRLALFRKICRADWNSLFHVKKITLSERKRVPKALRKRQISLRFLADDMPKERCLKARFFG